MRLHIWDDGRWMAEDDEGALISEGTWSQSPTSRAVTAAVTMWNPGRRPDPAGRRRCNELMSRAVVQMVSAVEALA